jgi:hypothetical protein
MVSTKREGPDSHGWARVIPYATLAFVSFLCALAILALLLWKAEMLVALGLTGNLYFVVLVPLGLSVALTLFGVLESYASYSGKHLGGLLKLGGPVVALFLVLIAGFWLPQPASNFPLTVYVHGPGGKQDLILRGNGFARIDTGGLPRKAAIGNDGEAVFTEIPANFRGQEVNVSVDADGYELADSNQKVRLNASSVYVQVKRKAGRLTGRVRDDLSRPLGGVNVTVAGLATTTDATGYFQLVIPGEQRQPEMTLQAAAPGYNSATERVVPNSNEMAITLHRQN